MKRRRGRGVATIEAALVLLAGTCLLADLVYCGRLAQKGAALDNAASNAARYLAALPLEDLHDSARRSAALATAQGMVDQALAAASIEAQDLQLDYLCDPTPCAALPPGSTPGKVGVNAALQFHDELFGQSLSTQLTAYAEASRDN